ncbi:MAG TPA: hypothetical protein VIL49_00970 [Capillimicrobium sp.]|jgi:hypothetical protein
MDQNDLGRALQAGADLGRAAVGAGFAIALTPLRLVKHAIRPAPSQPESASWTPPPQPSPPPAPPVALRDEQEPVPAPEPEATAAAAAANGSATEAPPAPPEPPADVPRSNDLSAAEAARMRDEERREETDDDSPGPEIHVAAPWPGYEKQNVSQILDKLTGADPTTKAMVRLFEETHKNRKGILRATE